MILKSSFLLKRMFFNPKIFFIVPSAEHVERITSLLVQRSLPGLLSKRILTFAQLVNQTFLQSPSLVVSSVTRTMIIKEILEDQAFPYFSKVGESPGLIKLLSQWILELKESLIQPSLFRQRMNALKLFEPVYEIKYEALATLYEAYQEALEARGLQDPQDAIQLFLSQSSSARETSYYKTIWIDGFFDFSNLQLECLKYVASVSKKVVVSLTLDDRKGREELFENVQQTQSVLVKQGFEIKRIKSPSFRTQKPALLHLQKNLFSTQKEKAFDKSQGEVIFLEAIGIQGEIELIARQIHKLYQTGKYRYSDFAILLRQIKNYEPILQSVFSHYGLPFEIHERKRTQFSPWIQTITGLLLIFRRGWKKEDLFSFLKSSYVNQLGEVLKEDAQIFELEHQAIQYGIIEGRDSWLAEWPEEEGEEPFHELKMGLLEPLGELEDSLREVKEVRVFNQILKRFCDQIRHTSKLKVQNIDLLKQESISFKRFEILLDEIQTHFQKRKQDFFSLDAFVDYFVRLVEIDLYSFHSSHKNPIQIYGVSLSRQKEYKVVFVAGLLEKMFPLEIKEDPLFSDWERKLINTHLKYPLQERLQRQGLERYLFYLALTRAQEKLFLSCAYLNLEGKESLPSFYLDEVKQLFACPIPKIQQSLFRPYPTLQDCMNRQELEEAIVGTLSYELENPDQIDPLLLYMLYHLMQDKESQKRVRQAFLDVRAKIMDPEIKKTKAFKIKETSPTRLEEYAKCPYRYFSNHILKLQDRQEDQGAKQKGTILHSILENFFKASVKKSRNKQELDDFLKEELQKALQRYLLFTEKKYQADMAHKELYQMITSFLEQELERLESAAFYPLYLEYGFGSSPDLQGPALAIQDGDDKILLQGRIDRIDVDSDQKFSVVMDYKRTASFKRSDLSLGIALQLPLYLLAVKKNLKLSPLGGEFYSIKNKKRVGFYSKTYAKKFSKDFFIKVAARECGLSSYF